jgi:UDP-4-amino-4,6-dideoxy-N-acetyl-beta-L-altrosamine transaminase
LLPYGRQTIDDDDVAAVAAVLRSDFLTTGPAVGAFESALAERVGARRAAACSSGTAGLHLALEALGVGPGDSVVVPSLTFVATANVVRHVGAEVVFADVDPDTGLMGPAEFEAALDSATGADVKAVVPVHLNGQCADIGAISAIAGERGIAVVEDACHAVGTRYDADGEDVAVGSCRHGGLCVFSFHPVKTIAMGEGGAVTTNDEALHRSLVRLRNHGLVRNDARTENREPGLAAEGAGGPWSYELAEPGFNYRASDIHCALGLSQLRKMDRFIARRAELVGLYDSFLAPLASTVRPIGRVEGCKPAWHLYAVLIDFARAGIARAELMVRLRELGIGTQVHFLPVHKQLYYVCRYGTVELPGVEAYFRRCLSLPLFPAMRNEDADRVVGALTKLLGAA